MSEGSKRQLAALLIINLISLCAARHDDAEVHSPKRSLLQVKVFPRGDVAAMIQGERRKRVESRKSVFYAVHRLDSLLSRVLSYRERYDFVNRI